MAQVSMGDIRQDVLRSRLALLLAALLMHFTACTAPARLTWESHHKAKTPRAALAQAQASTAQYICV